MSKPFDVVIIGAGPGGYVAAIKAGQLGLSTMLIEKEHLGGVCLNWGCIPTKALLASSDRYRSIKEAEHFGLRVGDLGFDLDKIVSRSREVSQKLNSGIEHLLKKNKINTIFGTAKLIDKHNIMVTSKSGTKEVSAKHIIIATGSTARKLDNIPFDGTSVWSAKEAMMPNKLPKSLAIIGSGPIGLEFASFYNTFGTKVTVIESMPNILRNEDEEISQAAMRAFEKQGITFVTDATVTASKKDKNEVLLSLEDNHGTISTVSAEKVLVAVGVIPNTEGIGLENAQVELEKNYIKTNEYNQTNQQHIYAIGDVCSPPWLAHKASHEAIGCINHIAGIDVHPIDKSNIPGCIYSYPQIASIGLTEKHAKEQGMEIKVGKFPLSANGKAIAVNETEGFVKVIFDAKTGELLGAHMIGAEVTEMIQGFGIAKTLETTEKELLHTIFAHPTISESMHEAVLNAYNAAIHI